MASPAGSGDEAVGEEWGAWLPRGDVVGPGKSVTGTGALTVTEPLVRGRWSHYWDHVFGLCEVDAAEVVVFDTARR